MEVSCLELALEGERLCKVGDYRAGVSFFEAAIQVGTEDLQVLSAIYSQLGNAYFHLHDYAKAQEFHRHDLTLTRWDVRQTAAGAAMLFFTHVTLFARQDYWRPAGGSQGQREPGQHAEGVGPLRRGRGLLPATSGHQPRPQRQGE